MTDVRSKVVRQTFFQSVVELLDEAVEQVASLLLMELQDLQEIWLNLSHVGKQCPLLHRKDSLISNVHDLNQTRENYLNRKLILPVGCLVVSVFNFSDDVKADDDSLSTVGTSGLGYGRTFILLNRSLSSAKFFLSIGFVNFNCTQL